MPELSITCAQPVARHRISSAQNNNLSTYTPLPRLTQWKNRVCTLSDIHIFCIRFCTPKLSKITDRGHGFSPLSTTLTKNNNSKRKESYSNTLWRTRQA